MVGVELAGRLSTRNVQLHSECYVIEHMLFTKWARLSIPESIHDILGLYFIDEYFGTLFLPQVLPGDNYALPSHSQSEAWSMRPDVRVLIYTIEIQTVTSTPMMSIMSPFLDC